MNEEQQLNGLPESWRWMKLGEAVQVLDNLRKPINSSERQKRIENKSVEELYPYYGATGQVGWIDDFITEGEYVLVGEDGAPFLDNFKEKAYKIKGKTWVNNHAHILKERENISLTNFILHYLNSINYREYVNGTTRLKLTKGSLVEIPFPVPPKETQQQIVSKIEELFSELDKGIEELQTAQQQLKVYRQAVLKWAFEGKLTNKDIKDGELPEGWTLQNIGSIAKLINGDRGKNYPNRNEYVDKGIAFINTGHIEPNGKLSLETMHYLTREKFNSLNSGKIQKGDLLYCLRGATLGKTAVVDQFEEGAIASSLVIIRLNKEISNRFVYYFLTGPLGRDCIFRFDNGSAQPNLSAKSVTLYKIPLPSLDEQLKVVQEIESRLSVCDKIEETITSSLKQAEALRQSILKKAFEGKLL